jgi:hypothetical protein
LELKKVNLFFTFFWNYLDKLPFVWYNIIEVREKGFEKKERIEMVKCEKIEVGGKFCLKCKGSFCNQGNVAKRCVLLQTVKVFVKKAQSK